MTPIAAWPGGLFAINHNLLQSLLNPVRVKRGEIYGCAYLQLVIISTDQRPTIDIFISN